MPIYGYICKSCEHTLDALQKMADDPLVDCPSCGEPALKRALSAPRFRLKGQGWYETDFKKDNQKNVLQSDSKPAKTDGKEDKADKKDSKESETKTKSTSKTGAE